MTGARSLTAVLLAGLGCLLAVGVVGRPASVAPRAAVADRLAPLTALATWDRARAAAWRVGDPAALDRLYAPGSSSGAADRALLSAYVERGLRVTRLRMQRAAVVVVSEESDRIVLVVTDRVIGATATGRRGRVILPRDGWSTRTVVLARIGEEWRVAEVLDQARPVASTEVTSRSENS